MGKRGYHHGNLRQALVEAALDLIEEKGPTGFTLSEAAKLAGVTPAAVYRHFAGRDDLIAEAARQGYEIFADVMAYPGYPHRLLRRAFLFLGGLGRIRRVSAEWRALACVATYGGAFNHDHPNTPTFMQLVPQWLKERDEYEYGMPPITDPLVRPMLQAMVAAYAQEPGSYFGEEAMYNAGMLHVEAANKAFYRGLYRTLWLSWAIVSF